MSLTNQANRKRLNGCSVKTISEDTIMKMFKKLMAVALAGVMAMAVLTGCGSSLNEKEVIAVINDAIKSPLAKVVEDETGEKNVEITFKAADSELKDKTKAVAGIVEEKIGEKDTIDTILQNKAKRNAILDALAGKDRKDTNMYLVSYATKVKYDSKLFNTLNEGINALEIAQNITKNKVVHVSTDIANYKTKGTGMMAFQDVTVNGKTYTIVVMKIDTQKKA